MNVRKIIFFLLILIFYFILTFIISLFNISNQVVTGNIESLNNYLLKDSLKKNINKDINSFIYKNLDDLKLDFNFNKDGLEFSGTFSDDFILKTYKQIADSISSDFSDAKIILYFYYNSGEISIYFENYVSKLGNYSFDSFQKEKDINIETYLNKKQNQNIEKISENKIKMNKENYSLKVRRILKKINSLKYFFFSSPIHFKMTVIHQNLPFTIIFKFNGYTWKVSNIIINYQTLIQHKMNSQF